MLRVDNLVYKKGNRLILNNISLGIEQGKIIGLLGPNGSGKTTLMQALAGNIKMKSGSIYLNGKSDRNELLNNTVYMDHQMRFNGNWTGKVLVDLYASSRKDFNHERFIEMAKELQIDLTSKLQVLSRGEKEKLMLSLSLAQEVDFYFLDEPLTGVDILTREAVIKSLLTYASPEATIIISSHCIDIFELLFDSVIFIQEGQIVTNIDPEAVRQEGISLSSYYKQIFSENGGVNNEENILEI